MTKIIVLVTEGRDDSADYAKVVLFDTKQEAEVFIDTVSSKERTKYWTQAEIVYNKEQVRLCSPDFDNM